MDKVIGDMLFDPEDEDEQVSKEACTIDVYKNSDSDSYTIQIKNL